MSSRNLTEVFLLMRNNAAKNRNHFAHDRRHSDSERLLKHSLRDAEEGLELQDDLNTPPIWLDKLEEAQYTMSKIKPKLDELGSLHARHLLRPTFNEHAEEEAEIDQLSQEISKLITSTHRHIQCIRSSLGVGNRSEQRLTANAVACALLQLQDMSNKFRNSQNIYVRQLASREERSQKYFENGEFTTIDLNSHDSPPLVHSQSYLFDDEYQQEIDEHFQKPVTGRVTQQQILLFEEENSRMAKHREMEVTNILKSLNDLNDIFKDLNNLVLDQGTVLDRIDYNVEMAQSRVTEGLRQLQRAEIYQRKNRKMCVILVLATVTLCMLLILIITKF